jgi:hypothetical protein
MGIIFNSQNDANTQALIKALLLCFAAQYLATRLV